MKVYPFMMLLIPSLKKLNHNLVSRLSNYSTCTCYKHHISTRNLTKSTRVMNLMYSYNQLSIFSTSYNLDGVIFMTFFFFIFHLQIVTFINALIVYKLFTISTCILLLFYSIINFILDCYVWTNIINTHIRKKLNQIKIKILLL